MENGRSPNGSPRRSPNGSPRVSPNGSPLARVSPRRSPYASPLARRSPNASPLARVSPRADYINPIKIPKEGDNDAMLLWRATVSPIDNIGEPYLAEWMGDRPPPTGRYVIDNSGPRRWMRLSYAMPDVEHTAYGWWLPGYLEEDVYIPNNFGVEDEFFPAAYVAHSTNLAGYEALYQPPPFAAIEPIPLGTLDDEWVELLARETSKKGKGYVKNFVDRYIKTIRPFDARYTRAVDKRLREDIVKLLMDAGRRRPDEVEMYACDRWERDIHPRVDEEGAIGFGDSPDESRVPRLDVEENERYNNLALDADFLEDDLGSETLYNARGRIAVPANKDQAANWSRWMYRFNGNFQRDQSLRFPHLKPAEEGRRRKSQRKRDKKILKEHKEDMKRQGQDPSAVYDGGRRRRTRKHKHAGAGMRTRKSKLAGKRTNRKTRGIK